MKLIGMLDSPYVRRVAIGLKLLDVPFEHHALSVFSTFDEFKKINPVVKAPTLVLDDGQVLMDSTLILDYAQTLARNDVRLLPQDPQSRLKALRVIGLALAACEKTVQIVYETKLRPADKQHAPWLDRVRDQLTAAYDGLETALQGTKAPPSAEALGLAEVSVAVSWTFTCLMLPEWTVDRNLPVVQSLTALAETFPVFLSTPV